MICASCRIAAHASCDNTQPGHGGGNWCDCQHKPRDGDGLVIDGWPGTFTIYGTLEDKRGP